MPPVGPRPILSTNLAQHRLGRGGRVRIAVEDVPPRKINLSTFDPDIWLKYSRTTPGQTNRLLEDRWPDEVFPNNHISVQPEMADTNVVNNLPEVLYRQQYLQFAIFSAVLVAAYIAVK